MQARMGWIRSLTDWRLCHHIMWWQTYECETSDNCFPLQYTYVIYRQHFGEAQIYGLNTLSMCEINENRALKYKTYPQIKCQVKCKVL